MVKRSKIKTPDWLLDGSSQNTGENKKKKGKTFKVKMCPSCGSDQVELVLSNSDSEEGGGKEWKCKKCGWVGSEINEKELTEEEFLRYLDEKGEEVA